MYFFLCHLSFLDLCYTTSTVPQLLINLHAHDRTITYGGCVAQLFISLALGSTECVLLVVMAFDRYAAVCRPLHYTTIMHPQLCQTLALISWVGGLLNSLIQAGLMMAMPLCGLQILNHFFCEMPVLLKLACENTDGTEAKMFVARAIILVGPATLILGSYVHIVKAVLKVKSMTGRRKAFGTCAPVAGTACHAYDREVHLRCELPPGHYLAVPSTFLKDAPGQFLLRVFIGRVSLSAVRPATPSARPREAPPAGEWETVQLRGAGRAGQTAGGSRNFASFPTNPCFPLSVPEGAGVRSVRISLLQHCEGGRCLPNGFQVFQVPPGGQGTPPLLQEPVLSCVPHRYAQEVSRLCQLAAGAYSVVPSTYLPDTEGAFTVTVATRIDRRSLHSQEALGRPLQEASFVAVRRT
ncbi:Calpain-10 [Galemys pyrenaicus]|uniref:Calpain-10 n=1 Tax=Galemys pyrenaicus TaxID=202257 RepID=A0A8J6B2S9_GALPY|nr:Calpain-10 [Galemys pyrenaicus]